MIHKLNLKLFFTKFHFWLVIWLLLVTAYSFSIKFKFHTNEWNYIIFIIQFIVDIHIVIFGYLASQNKTHAKTRVFYFLIGLSLLPGVFANESYNILINILKCNISNSEISIFWRFGYTLFLTIQVASWLYLILLNKNNNGFKLKNYVSSLPYLQSCIIVFLSLIIILKLRTVTLNIIGTFGLVNSILEAMLFNLISICLSKTKDKSLIYLEMGFLLLIAFNMAHRFSHIPGNFFKIFDVLWLPCLLTMIFGLIKTWKEDKKIVFLEQNSIHVLMSAIFIAFASFIFIIFLIIELLITYIKPSEFDTISLVAQNIPSILIFAYSLSVMISKLVADYLFNPFQEMTNTVLNMHHNKLDIQNEPPRKFNIYEIDKFNDFILNMISKLHAANQVKSNFLMQMSHDFRTPTSGIYHLSRSIHKRTKDKHLMQHQKLIVDSSEQLMNHLDNVLDYSRLENNTFKLSITEFDIIYIVEEIISFLFPKLIEKDLKVNKSYMGTSIYFTNDKSLVQKIILNILTNAIKFTHNGSVNVSIKRFYDKRHYVLIEIQDTGIGIDTKHHQSIFEAFYKIETIDSMNLPGIGLGLSNVKLMLGQIGGSISLQSALNKGSIFRVLLPFIDC